ncbi:MAG: ABC transporter ATP-binding protein/permease [Treponema sp.]|jgi:ATP-binding cassette subfamily B protein|nr:ABC transporter ATP-binding protein/permease [Treponema sp.]
MESRGLLKKNGRFYVSVFLNILDGMFSGTGFMVFFLVLRNLSMGGLTKGAIIQYSTALAALYVLRLMLYITGYTQGQYGGSAITRRIRIFLGDKLKKMPLNRFVQKKTGYYINIVTGSINSYENVLTHKSGDIAKNVSFLCLCVCFMSFLYFPAGLIVFAATALIIPCVRIAYSKVRIYGVQKNKNQEAAVSDVVEYTAGIQTFRAYGFAGEKNEVLTASLKQYSGISYQFEKSTLPPGMLYMIIAWCAFPACLVIGGAAWLNGYLPASDFLLAAMLPLFTGKLSGTLFIDLTFYKNLMISRDAIVSLAEEEEEPAPDKSFAPADYRVVFDDVIFCYAAGEQALKGVSFTAEQGKFTAIIGDSGSGKSTILNLAAKYYVPDRGTVRIGGTDIRNYPSEQVLHYISMVDQDTFLFNDTVMNNIRLARPGARDDEIVSACRQANCDSFIMNLEDGYNTPIGENGSQLSGGERQRLSIARAILKDSPILLLDEATASLDIENELAVRKAIARLLGQRKTVIMVAHALSIIQNADLILVADRGKIIERGSHEQLLLLDGKYTDMWKAEQKLRVIPDRDVYKPDLLNERYSHPRR